MNLTIAFDPAMQAELEAEASAREIPCEQVVCEAVEEYLQRPRSQNLEYDAFFLQKYEEGMADYKAGRITTNEEVEREAQILREKLKAMIATRR